MSIVYALQSVASPFLDQVMLLITQLGNEYVYVGLLIVAFVAVDAERGRSLALTLLASFYLNAVLKSLFATQRPFMIDEGVARSSAAVETAPGNGFPSGHAQGSATFWTMASAYVARRWFTVLSVVLVVLIAVSRVYLGVHLPIDVVGGAAFGLAVVGVSLMLQRRGARLGRSAAIVLGIGVPLLVQVLYQTDISGMLLGAFAAFAAGPELVRHDTSGPLKGRVLLAAIALVLVLAAMLGSSALLPEAVKRDALGSFARFLVIGAIGTVFVPWLGKVTGLTRPAEPVVVVPAATAGESPR